jgi:hypothetical protein
VEPSRTLRRRDRQRGGRQKLVSWFGGGVRGAARHVASDRVGRRGRFWRRLRVRHQAGAPFEAPAIDPRIPVVAEAELEAAFTVAERLRGEQRLEPPRALRDGQLVPGREPTGLRLRFVGEAAAKDQSTARELAGDVAAARGRARNRSGSGVASIDRPPGVVHLTTSFNAQS